MHQRLYAFWKYDTFPYILGGEVKNFNDNGLVYIEAFQGTFKPILILPLAKGLQIQEELHTLERLYKKEMKELRSTMIKKVVKICPQFNEFL